MTVRTLTTTPAASIRQLSVEAIRPLRLEILRPPGSPLSSVVFPGDDDVDAVHFGAVIEDKIVSCVTIFPKPRPGLESVASDPDSSGWQLRGMASAESVRGMGLGIGVLRACLDHIRSRAGSEVWCNARTCAAGFYSKQGFEILTPEPFEIAGVGPHYVMRRRL